MTRMEREARVENVKKALLAMQRFAWEQGVTAQAFLELGEREWVILLAKDAVNRQIEDGRLAFMGEVSVTDPAANGEAVLFAAKATGDQRFKEAADDMLAWLLRRAPRNPDGILYHFSDKNQVWVDSFYNMVDNPETFRETNLAQMLAYSMYCGVAGGWPDKAYLKPADAMRQAAHQQVDEFGLVQEVCGSPHFDHSGTAPEGQAFFLLMEAAANAISR